MTALLTILCIALIAIIAIQIGKVTELASKIRGEEDMQEIVNRRNGNYSLVFMVVFLVACIISAGYYKNYMLGYGPHESASEHGKTLDSLFNITLFFTAIVFFLTQAALFYYAFKYRGARGRKPLYLPHDNKLEIIWTAIPAVVMTFLVVGGLDAWNDVMADIAPGEDFTEIEGTGYQFAWHLRYPGPDGKLGTRNFKLISGANPLGQDWTDEKNLDDLHPSEVVLPVNKKVRVRITARDVLHNFYLPHFRVKMDAVPGMPTYFIFTPTKTTEEYRQELSNYPEYQVPDPNDLEKMRWETFNYELACAELCGTGHYSMRRLVRIVSEEEYKAWLSQQQSYFLSSIRGTEDDPYKNELLDIEVKQRKLEFSDAIQKAIDATDAKEKLLRLNYVYFDAGAAKLTELSRYELDNLAESLNKYPNMTIEVGGHTDNTGDAAQNLTLSSERARAVKDYLVGKGIAASRLQAVGYGQNQPADTNDTEAGREKNRRTEFKILTQ
ncbi:MAG: OmpA family protein [Saprospiraceae bacterium]|nr:OmpA family protein [Saprospiraceae bacterium]MDZ4704313.1 OmpA family protein [Saprospiraceae bacterium]